MTEEQLIEVQLVRMNAVDSLKETLKRLSKLKDESFNYGDFISKDDKECGTVCCAVGWYPKWFPESGFEWDIRRYINPLTGSRIDLRYNGITTKTSVIYGLSEFHLISKSLIECLFFGNSFVIERSLFLKWKDLINKEVVRDSDSNHVCIGLARILKASKSEVMYLFQLIIDMLENRDLDQELIITHAEK